MDMSKSILTLPDGAGTTRVDAHRARFSAYQTFHYDGDPVEARLLEALAADLSGRPGLALYGAGPLLEALLTAAPQLAEECLALLVDDHAPSTVPEGLRPVPVAEIPAEVKTVFLAETRMFERMRMAKRLPAGVEVVDADRIAEVAMDQLPARSWVPFARDVIYPIDIPEVTFEPGVEMILMDLPARNLGMMPNGLAYVHNELKKTGVHFQTVDCDILFYHRFHVRRIFDHAGKMRLADGRELPPDPWQAEHYDLWSNPQMLELFQADLDEVVDAVVAANPKVLGLSVQGCNEQQTRYVVNAVKKRAPDIVILVGGFSCYNRDIGLRAFPECDYMCIGEADLTVGPLVEQLVAGERPTNVPGVLCHEDDPNLPFIPGPMPHDLDKIEIARYEWFDSLDIYRNFNGYQLTPVIASRGCRWSRCTFCAERFYWRIRSPKAFVDEIEWLVDQGCHLFMFNESDLNGMPEVLLEICEEIIRRDLKIKLTGQLRIHRKSDRHFFETLAKAGFVALRFGVDAFSSKALKLQAKGYDQDRVRQNLKDCWEVGIFTEVNWVIGVPGETPEDIQEGIDFIVENKPYIGRVANINPLILVYGSVYWAQPEAHGIEFRGDPDELKVKYPRAVPAHLWYSTGPYIDHKVRREYFKTIVKGLHDNGFDMGAWAERIINDVVTGADKNRAGGGDEDEAADELHAEAGAHEAPAEADVAAQVAAEDAAEGVSDSFSALRSWDLDRDGETVAKAPGKDDAAFPRSVDDPTLISQEEQKKGAYAMRAGGILPPEVVPTFGERLAVLRYRDELYVVEPDRLPGELGGAIDAEQPVHDLRDRAEVQRAITVNATPELVQSLDRYNVVKYDGFFWGLPQSAGSVTWGEQDVEGLEGVVVTDTFEECLKGVEAELKKIGLMRKGKELGKSVWRRLRAAFARPKDEAPSKATASEGKAKAGKVAFAASKASDDATPKEVGVLEDYRILEYEGWYYGVPKSLGDIRLDETDVMEMPGVLRDVSREVVENDIRESRSGAMAV